MMVKVDIWKASNQGYMKQEIYYGVVYYSYEELKSEIEAQKAIFYLRQQETMSAQAEIEK